MGLQRLPTIVTLDFTYCNYKFATLDVSGSGHGLASA